MTDMQAAIGCAQIERLDTFVETRRENWQIYRTAFADLEDRLEFAGVSAHEMPSPFGFLVTTRDGRRDELVRALEAKRIQTRPLFAGNILRQPAMKNVQFRTTGALHATDAAMNNAFWIGVHPLTKKMMNYVVEVMHEVLR
jgi:CDP-6-deoxy-D-xylo-4-hexulose-3-dehydrase